MFKLVLMRHGESQWNLENRFTGWTDVDLTEKGREEARKAGELLKAEGYDFDAATKSKCPIVPVALIDSFKAFDTGSVKKLTVQVHFLEPIYYEEYKDMKTTEIASEVKRRIEETIARYA